MHGFVKSRYGIRVLGKSTRGDFKNDIFGSQNDWAQRDFTSLSKFDKVQRHPEETCHPESLVVAHPLEVATNSLRTGVDTKDRLGERPFFE